MRTIEKLEEVFREVFGEDSIVLRPEMTAADFDGWDSLLHITLVIAIEAHFGMRFATAEIARLKENGSTVGTMVELLEAKVAPRR